MTPADCCGAKSLPWDSVVAASGLSPGKDTAEAVTPPARPRPASWGSPRTARWQDGWEAGASDGLECDSARAACQ